jgi:hypothetical protein
MMYAFAVYYQSLGWRVIIYDRFGLHKEHMQSLLHLPGIDYYEYTVLQLAMPSKYNQKYKEEQGRDRKFYYRMEKNWGYTGRQADTADQDQDKTRTYDFARIEYAHLDVMLYIDIDEWFYCPQAKHSIEQQKRFQHRLLSTYVAQGIEEMRFVRLPYSGKAPSSFNETSGDRGLISKKTEQCTYQAYLSKDVAAFMGCWSSASAYDNFPKSADLANICPFHYNHWSCDGMRNGGRDYGNGPRCRCKVAFDLINGFEYKPLVDKCHLLHLNDEKYLFQSRREKHINDKGSIFEENGVAMMLKSSLKEGKANNK